MVHRKYLSPKMMVRQRHRTPLSWAAESEQYEVVRVLLQKKDIDVNKVDDLGRSPLFLGCADGTYQCHSATVGEG